MDDATVENGCMTVIPGSHKWGPVAQEYKYTFLDDHLVREPVPAEVRPEIVGRHSPPLPDLPRSAALANLLSGNIP